MKRLPRLARLFSHLALAGLAGAVVWLFLLAPPSPSPGNGDRTTATSPDGRDAEQRPVPRPERISPPPDPALAMPRLPDLFGPLSSLLRPPTQPGPELRQTPIAGAIDRILIEKSARRLTAFQDGRPIRRFRVALGFAPEGTKARQGDGRTPEGIFRIDRRNHRSAYHLSLGIDYPRAEDRARARRAGLDPGGDIFIHGQPNELPRGTRLSHDWTDGCIAIADAEIEELFRATPIGTEVEIRP